MATQRLFGREIGNRAALYALFGVLALLPIAGFAIGPLSGDSFSLSGPAGPMLAFSAGVLSFVSPCVLPLVPIYITHLSGAAFDHGRLVASRRATFSHAVAFVSGLSLVFIVLGGSVGLAGSYFFRDNQRVMEQGAGFLLVVMGIVLVPAATTRSARRSAIVLLLIAAAYFLVAEVSGIRGDRSRIAALGTVLGLAVLRFSGYLELPFLNRTVEVNVGRKQAGYARSALVGGAFAIGWTPCVGPILGGILTLAATSSEAWTGAYLLVFYSLGFSVPFLITGLALSDVSAVLRRIQRYTGVVEVASSVMLISVGVLLLTGRLSGLNRFFSFADFNNGL